MWPWWINYPFWLDADCLCLPLHECIMSVHVCPSVCMCSYLQHVKVCYSLSLVQFSCSVMYDSLQPMYYNTPPRPSPTPRACSNSYPSGHWRHPTISSSVLSFSSCLQSFPASGSFPISQFFTSGGQSIGVSASPSVLPMNFQDWFPLGWTGWISL